LAESSSKPKVIVVQGPTACGKTGLAIEVCKRFDGEVINADSLQWVKHFDIGTAKPTPDEMRQARHHIIDVMEPDQEYDAAIYTKMAREIIAEVISRGKVPVVAGGTGLYVRTLLGGIVDLPGRNDEIRGKYEKILEEHGAEVLFEELRSLDPEAEQHIDKHNPRRVIRALEVILQTGKPIWVWQAEHKFKESPYNSFNIALKPDLEKLDKRIMIRSQQMLDQGLIEETENLLERFPDKSLKPFGSIGYKQVVEYLGGKIERSELLEKIAQATRRYARKQVRWLKTEDCIKWIDSENPLSVLNDIETFLNS